MQLEFGLWSVKFDESETGLKFFVENLVGGDASVPITETLTWKGA